MAHVIVNANGTVSNSFSIGKSGRGIVIYQGDSVPSDSIGNIGDIFVKRSIEPLLMKKNSTGWSNICNKEVLSLSTNNTLNPTQSQTVYLVDTSSSPVTLTLSSLSLEVGKEIIIKDASGSASINNITIETEGDELIDTKTSFEIALDHTSTTMLCDGYNWHII